MVKKKFAIIGANEFQNRLILKAKEMGFETHVFAWQAGDVGEYTADCFYPISITDKEEILEQCRKIQPEGVVSIGSDLAVHAVCYVAEALGLTTNSSADMLACTNKFEMRRRFRDARLDTPQFIKVAEGEAPELSGLRFPVIVKPTDRSGSRGITKVHGEDALPSALETAWENSFERAAIVEEYIEGEEYSLETISYAGNHRLLAVTKKFTTGAPHFIETGHQQPSGLPEEWIQRAEKLIFRALDALHIQYGASHSEVRINDRGEIRIIEIGARMGGDCIGSDLVQISTGYDYVRMVIDIACGKTPDLTPVSEPKLADIRFIFTQADIQRLQEIQRNEPEHIWRVSDIQEVGSRDVTDSSTRFGYYILARPLNAGN